LATADAKGRRWDATTGIVAMGLFIAGFLLPGTPPKADDPVPKITAFFVNHRSDILAGDALIALGAVFFLWWLGSLRSYLRAAEGGEGRLSAAAFGGGVLGTALTIGGAAVLSGIVFKVAKLGNPLLNRAMFDIAGNLFAIAGVGFAVLLGAAACSAARSGALPPWTYWLGSVAAVAQLLSVAPIFASSGFFAGGGAIAPVAFFAAAIWVVAVSVLMIQRDGVPPVMRTEP
jgi:TM2 domain-containing membrane protein YozV